MPEIVLLAFRERPCNENLRYPLEINLAGTFGTGTKLFEKEEASGWLPN